MKTFTILFENEEGNQITKFIQGNNLEEATIEGSNMGDENGWEMLQID
jgi:hypothetical protein